MDQTTAQVTDQTVQTQEAPQQTTIPKERFDEVLAARRDAEKRAEELQQKMMELTANLVAQQQPRQQAPTPIDPLSQYREQLDPTLVKVLEAQQLNFQQEMARRTAMLEAAQGKLYIQQMASSNPGLKPEVIAKAQQLFEQSKLNGNNPSPDEALRYAIGDEFLRQTQRAAQVAGFQTTQFNVPAATLPTATVPAPQATTHQLPADFESRSLADQIALMERAGFGNQPI